MIKRVHSSFNDSIASEENWNGLNRAVRKHLILIEWCIKITSPDKAKVIEAVMRHFQAQNTVRLFYYGVRRLFCSKKRTRSSKGMESSTHKSSPIQDGTIKIKTLSSTLSFAVRSLKRVHNLSVYTFLLRLVCIWRKINIQNVSIDNLWN